ncbi:MAG: phosphoenolpyruvate synthase, partial [Rikenellaceae bacterium]|nr:phosphoenolpyruvate synthase [Rikenellaceae bacterium]
ASRLPEQLISELKAYLATVDYPLAVRSSSKLEDSHYQPFAGIYSTYMIPNTEDKSQMLRLLSKAIKSVYASVYFAASRAYIATSSNLLSEEKMAVIVQQVCGTLEDGYFFPTLSGVARSINHYPIGDERPEEGIVNIALGLGKMVVDGGQTLRFSPHYPQKALQTSTLELTLRDTQREFYALDMRPSSFHISSDDSVNLARLTVADHSSMRNVQHASSTWNMLENTISESPFDKGRKLVTFNRILKYGSFPLAQIIENLLAMGEQEMRCPVEMEFAVNLDVKAGQKKIFNFLQIRPIISTNDDISTQWDEHSGDGALIYAERALGVGAMHGISDIIYVKPQAFDNLRTEQIATELLNLNLRMRDEGRGYVLVGPGRWGSSDPFLGIPVKWSHISEARVIVECGLENFRVEPSQGTHFFQNVTSLGIGYLTINPFEGDGAFDIDRLDAMTATEEGEFLRRVSFEEPLTVYIDGRNNRGVVKIAK